MTKHFIFEVTEVDGRLTFKSEGNGFFIYEALGFLEWKKADLLGQIAGTIKPDVVSRTCIIDGDKNTEQQVQADSLEAHSLT